MSDKKKKNKSIPLETIITNGEVSIRDTLYSPSFFGDDPETDNVETTVRLDKRAMRGENPDSEYNQFFWVVRVTAGPDMLRFIVLLANEQAWIGRDSSNELQINDRTVSKRHALLLSKPSFETNNSHHDHHDHGRLYLVDEFSTNGTIVNRQNRRSRIKKIELRMEDRIEIGDISLVVSLMNIQELNHLKRVVTQLETANQDPLTGLLTRRFEETNLPQIVEQTELQDEPISCGFIDLDKFKQINDNFGHNIGDEVLKNFARIILFHLRNTDYCIRRGGDEFLVFLPGTDETTAKRVFERIRTAIADHSWQKIAQNLSASASFGVAQKDPKETIETWIHHADQAVYVSKDTGRNKVCVFSQISKSQRPI